MQGLTGNRLYYRPGRDTSVVAARLLQKDIGVSDSKLVLPEKGSSKARSPKSGDAIRTWAILGWVGLAFLVVGGADFALTWYPMDFGNREWEFGTVTASFNGLPILVLGLGLLLTSSLQSGRRWWSLLAALGAFVLALWIVVGVVLWATNVPLALSSVPPDVMIGMKKSIAKTVVQSVTYPVVLTYLGVRSVKALRGG